MVIPALTSDGLLPEGVHECSPEELSARFGQFQGTNQRCLLIEKFRELLQLVALSGLVQYVIVDGSFVTDKAEPGDIDLVLVLARDFDLARQYTRWVEAVVLDTQALRKKSGFDVFVYPEGSGALAKRLEHFAGVRGKPGWKKGMLKVRP